MWIGAGAGAAKTPDTKAATGRKRVEKYMVRLRDT